ncbi:hypothetical protein [Aliarcobacter butzleri]|uniref:hypothetical protein n=1 Tax=Aliarcobacter butzleri TaxID=28197 RepID=UPI0002295C1B|nr:hypothetical protein [Aliarcobacter butzleri]KLE10968.1 hypothetical protein AF79_02105 [Aliarcobacter butzleri L354]MCG3654541.1 hypothetical protein [Aliarcobacter butzleri]MCG3663607.1 hypothetical protein [Aliarcobacter butzleri]MCG3666024.1 hypothetical protein [Aliarcobacter butzleri]MCG3670468.1 hypothetical protein [Aliarcobacter butzleri]
MILKLSFLSLILNCSLFAVTVLVSKTAIKYEEKIDPSNVIVKEVESINKACTPLTLQQLESNQFVTTHYINKNMIICDKDVKSSENEGVVFNFGGVKIEKKGRIIFENNEFIRIKNLDGTIEQIYKDGRLK